MADPDARRQNRKLNILIAIGVVVVVACAATVGFVLWRSNGATSESGTDGQTQGIIDEVGGLYVLPAGETPTVARIEDTSKLQSGQTFYDKAKNGDYVLVFNKSRIAMLYRQSEGKLVFVSQVTTNNPEDPITAAD